ncbi:MAG TPA: ArdC family protein [Acidimicrobiales bacterium]|nr:ArdC family protein [Acidimicrobiales bacterium]
MPNPKLIQVHDRLLHQLESLVESQDWREFLSVASRFHHYSTNNVLLILSQRPDATRVAGYRAWQRLGRQVRKGERGIQSWHPVSTGPGRSTTRRRPSGPSWSASCGAFRWRTCGTFSQTDGEPLPEIRPARWRTRGYSAPHWCRSRAGAAASPPDDAS